MSKKVLIYGKGGWPFTHSARSAYGDRAEYIDITRDKNKFKEMLTHSGGKSLVPVIVEGDKVTIGHGGSWAAWAPAVAGK